MPHRMISPRHKANAKRLRQDMTDVERKLWRALRNGRFAGVKFRRQVPLGPYIADFLSYEARLIIEPDGSQHADCDNLARDTMRDMFLKSQGYHVLRFWNFQINSNFIATLDQIYSTLAKSVPYLQT
jgi:adenine-specific DNA-methyltransferase